MIHVTAKSAAAAGVAVAAMAAIRKDPDELVTIHCKFCQHESYVSRPDPDAAAHQHAKHLRAVHADLLEKYPSLSELSDGV